ncbi:hypothetical protein GUJ93_ZPchr0007g3000 [Zizania palustris]|uniref:Plant heme peroxidase family profile domain-containing protein n=1 Tax=Zizania palustris TaxID=103762 RepID=A0A8J5TF96_ZIZPA|nr:hypothetical protein GUJ93_ZPchr0007g3000 [Zizania palustris]
MMACASSLSMMVLVLVAAMAAAATAQLSATFYDTSCPNALSTIQSVVTAAVNNEPRMGASLLRLHFHDCFGCDASVLLADNGTFVGEQGALPNKGSLRGFDVVGNIKTQVEAVCQQIVSCADILAVAARDSVVALGGPSWTVLLGRRDSTTASKTNADNDLPSPSFDLVNLTTAFSNKGLSTADMVALSGAHTIGQAHCHDFRDRIYNETPHQLCLRDVAPGQLPTNLISQKGLLHSDQVLFNGSSTDNMVMIFASSAAAFSSAFATAMVNMGNISPKTGTAGEIRLNCSRVN